ncbi:CHAT domain-containing protein [Paracoccus sp. KR1-242]|uniref:CHAT domain-containing protein n=1 Tax=Paracoccus sp. KR1-242 TaxID=3410028 RepID=UPI003BFB245F
MNLISAPLWTDEQTSLPSLSSKIFYLIPVEDGSPPEASPMQGFAPSLMRHARLITSISTLPSDIWELTPERQNIRLSLKMAGLSPIMWAGQSKRALTRIITPPHFPFVVLLIGDAHNIQDYQPWIQAHTFPLVVVAPKGGTLSYEDLSINGLRNSFLKVCDALKGQVKDHELIAAQEAISNWTDIENREFEPKIGGHNAFTPALSALYTAGYKDIQNGPFTDLKDGITPYVRTLDILTESILNERAKIGLREANRAFPPTPELNLFSPSIYPHFQSTSIMGHGLNDEFKRDLLATRRMLKNQSGYSFILTSDRQKKALLGKDHKGNPRPNMFFRIRSEELTLGTAVVSILAASEFSATIRLPNSVNKTAGDVRQFSQHYHAKIMNDRKRRAAFSKVQKAITDSIPAEFLTYVEKSQTGIRLISDAHLEWANIRGLPLCVQKNVTKIPVTPGNLFISQVSPQPHENYCVSDFKEVLVLSALAENDPIEGMFGAAISAFEPHFGKRVKVRTERVRDEQSLREALNSFEGPMVIFDGHGSHDDDKAAALHLIDEAIDIWKLRSNTPRIPPIVLLSACSTHAADRNHATTANGFLAIGARTVLASAFPIDARDASAFVARLLYRIAEFVPVVNDREKRSVSWMEVMGGMIKMQLLTDFCRRLLKKEILDEESYTKFHLLGNMAINTHHPWPYEAVLDALVEIGLDRSKMLYELKSAAASSTAISYIQLGRPETILIHPDNYEEIG